MIDLVFFSPVIGIVTSNIIAVGILIAVLIIKNMRY